MINIIRSWESYHISDGFHCLLFLTLIIYKLKSPDFRMTAFWTWHICIQLSWIIHEQVILNLNQMQTSEIWKHYVNWLQLNKLMNNEKFWSAKKFMIIILYVR